MSYRQRLIIQIGKLIFEVLKKISTLKKDVRFKAKEYNLHKVKNIILVFIKNLKSFEVS